MSEEQEISNHHTYGGVTFRVVGTTETDIHIFLFVIYSLDKRGLGNFPQCFCRYCAQYCASFLLLKLQWLSLNFVMHKHRLLTFFKTNYDHELPDHITMW